MPSPTVQYQYANGSSNSTRLTGVTYPNGRAVNYGYGSSGDVNDAASRVTAIQSGAGATPLASYEYLGLGTVARVDYPEPSIENVLADGSGNNPNTGDIYTGLDQFGRIIDCYWRKHSTPTADIERVKYTYDRVGNRLTRQNVVAATTSNNFWDEKYTYDALYRLTDAKRGTLSSGSISPLKFEQSWTLDATGNWSQFSQDDTGDGTWDLQQTRTASKVNAITNIGATTGPTWATPAYDAAGNMTTIPKTDAPTTTYTAKYDAWNRLVKLTDTASSNTVQENAYDGRGFRTIRKTYNSGTLTETRHFYYTERWQCVEERLGTTPSSVPNRHFVWGVRYIDDLILRDRSVSGTLDERLYAQQDAGWNLTTITGPTGAPQQRVGYSPYGLYTVLNAVFAPASSTNEWETLFASYRFDPAPRVYVARRRHLSSPLGAWISRDPAGSGSALLYEILAGTTPALSAYANLYQYAGNQPLRYVDPFGLRDVEIVIYYYLGDNEILTSLPAIQKEVDRIFEDCFKRCCKKSKKGELEHNIKIRWEKLLDEKDFEAHRKQFGWAGGNFFGQNPSGINVGLRDSFTGPALAQTGDFAANMNPGKIREAIGKQKDLYNKTYTFSETVAATVAHELGLHAIGGVKGHYEEKGTIDAEKGRPGTTFSEKTCKKICDRMDID